METAQPAADATAAHPFDAAALVSALGRRLPDGRLVVDPDVLAAMSHDDAEWAPVGRAAAGVRAETEDQVRHVVRVCAEFGAPIVPRGAGTGLSGGANATDGAVVLDLSRMNQVLEIDRENMICVVPAGDREQRPQGRRRRARPVVPARPGQRPVVVDRRATWPPTRAACAASNTALPGITCSGSATSVSPPSSSRHAPAAAAQQQPAGTAIWSGCGRRTTRASPARPGRALRGVGRDAQGRRRFALRLPPGADRHHRARSLGRSAPCRLRRGGVADRPAGPLPHRAGILDRACLTASVEASASPRPPAPAAGAGRPRRDSAAGRIPGRSSRRRRHAVGRRPRRGPRPSTVRRARLAYPPGAARPPDRGRVRCPTRVPTMLRRSTTAAGAQHNSHNDRARHARLRRCSSRRRRRRRADRRAAATEEPFNTVAGGPSPASTASAAHTHGRELVPAPLALQRACAAP